MAGQNIPSETGASCGCKVGRIAEEYDLTNLNNTLIAYWTGEASEQRSTRQLAKYVNQQVLEKGLTTADIPPKEGEVENTYRLLTDEDISSGIRVQTRNELQRDGVPIEEIESDFVSHQSIYNHLTECLETTLDTPSEQERLQRSKEKLGALQTRTNVVTEDTLERLARSGVLEIGEFNVNVSITVTCQECLQEYPVRDILEDRSCDCFQSASNSV